MSIAARLTLGLVLSLASLQAASALEAGTYRGKGDGGETLSVVVKGGSATVDVTTEGCVGDATGRLRKVSGNQWQIRADGGCRIDFHKKGSRFTISESADCFGLHGMMCTFNGSVGAARK